MAGGIGGREVEKLTLLVGSNPLPNYVAAQMLAPREVTLIHSPETERPSRYLRAVLEGTGMVVDERCVPNATSAADIRKACEGLPAAGHHLHYTGGTKPMAAHARMAWGDASDARASYLDERQALLRFDDGCVEEVGKHELGLTLDRLLALHGARRAPKPGDNGGASAEELSSMTEAGWAFVSAVQRRHTTCANAATDEKVARDRLAEAVPQHWRGQESRWFEFLVKEAVSAVVGPGAIVEWDVSVQRGQPRWEEFQIDVAVLRGPRLYLISCTTSTAKKVCKGKLFEAMVRGRHIGGDLARVAVACLLGGLETNKAPPRLRMDLLREDIAEMWDSHSKPVVFGIDDVQEWSGPRPNYEALRSWLDS